jgi:hypothetical protein
MRIPRERARTAAQRQQRLASRRSLVLSCMRSLQIHLPLPYPPQRLYSRLLVMVRTPHYSTDTPELTHVRRSSLRWRNSQGYHRRYNRWQIADPDFHFHHFELGWTSLNGSQHSRDHGGTRNSNRLCNSTQRSHARYHRWSNRRCRGGHDCCRVPLLLLIPPPPEKSSRQ